MNRPPLGTTAPSSDPAKPAYEAKALGLVLLWCKAETHRVGEVGLLVPFEDMLVGRGVPGLKGFVRFGRHRPGAAPVIAPLEWALLDKEISREQLRATWNSEGIRITVLGGCPTFVNDTQIEQGASTTLVVGDLVLFWECALFLVVERERVMPALTHLTQSHTFASADSMKTVGEHPKVWRLRDEVSVAASREMNVLFLGESGTGKEAMARAVHDLSSRAKKLFNSMNVAAVQQGLFTSEMFGNLANYPHAGLPARDGLLPVVDDGTAFLDEVGGLSKDDQTKLCRAIESAEYHKVGEARARPLRARFVAATSADTSVFKKDFQHRFGWTIRVPPLRKRQEDIPLLIRHLVLKEAAARPKDMARFLERGADGQMYPRLAVELVSTLVQHPLPGNVRELQNILTRAIYESKGSWIELPQQLHEMAKKPPPSRKPPRIEIAPATSSKPPSVPAQSGRRPKCTKEEVVTALEIAGGSVQSAALILGVPRRTIRNWIEEYRVRVKDEAG